MKVNILFYSLSCLAVFASCKHAKPLMEARDADLTVQIMAIDDSSKDEQAVSYRARLIPDKKLMEGKTREEKNSLYYQMDSCFYFTVAGVKTYAALVQPIANGVSGSYEYLLQFEKPKLINTDTLSLVYQDKYINKKTYDVRLTGK